LEKGITRNRNLRREKNNNKATPRILMSKLKEDKLKERKKENRKAEEGNRVNDEKTKM